MKKLILFFISPLCLLLTWELATRTGFLDYRFFPAPSQIIYYLIFISPEEGIINDIFASLYRIAWGYSAGCLLGISLGFIMGLYKPVRIIFYPLVIATYPIPKIAILPLIMLIFGFGELSKIVIVAIGSFFLVLINTLNGVDNLPKMYFDLAKVYHTPYHQFLIKILIPGTLPTIFTGLKLALGYSLVMVVAAEFSGADSGIGYLIWQSWETFNIKAMYAGIFVIGILGFVFSLTLDVLERKLIPWQQK